MGRNLTSRKKRQSCFEDVSRYKATFRMSAGELSSELTPSSEASKKLHTRERKLLLGLAEDGLSTEIFSWAAVMEDKRWVT